MHSADTRFLLAAKMLGQVNTLADIGTDHAFLPIYLIDNNIAQHVIACDIAQGPLATAEQNIKKAGAENKISLRLADGLKGVKPGECNAVTVMGMGGETISQIIDSAPWLKAERQVLVLQPMTCDDRLRKYLNLNGFEIIEEKAVFSKGRVYTVIKTKWNDCKENTAPEFEYIGKLLEDNPSDAEKAFVLRRLKSMQKCLKNIEHITYKKELYEKLKIAIPNVEKIYNLYFE